MPLCPTCSADNPVGARFCNQCGARLDATAASERKSYTPKHLEDRILRQRATLKGERKRVTVLFCDIKGSTRLAQEAGAEAWHGILDRFFGILTAAVHRYEGTVNQYTGDGIMALFGAPLAQEDHAQRACFAALEMQRELRRFADDLRLTRALNLSLRVGLNSGEVIVGSIGDDLRMDYTAQGVTVHLAARMEHICEPGRVYLSCQTAQLVEGYFQLRSLGPMSVAGLDEPVKVYELEGEGAVKTRLDRSLARGTTPFIGREPELSHLLAALEDARQGHGQVVAVVGEAGIGKSRLCHEFARLGGESGFEVHRATGVPYANALPLHPVRTLALSRLGLGRNAEPADVRRLIAGTFLLENPGHAAILPSVFDFLGVGDGTVLAPEQTAAARSRLFELLAHYLPCPTDKPVLLLVEDLHFLDAASEEFLALLCARIRPHRTLLLLNYRPDYADGWLRPYLHLRIPVSALEAGELAHLARSRLGPDPALAALAGQIGARAAGNPFFVEEAVQSFADAGHLRGSPGAYALDRPIPQGQDWPIPDTVHALLATRIDRLPDATKSLLQTAAVIGQHFAPQALAALAGVEAERCAAQLGELEQSGFVHRQTAGNAEEYGFRHPLMREVAYGGQLEAHRARTHACLAAALEAAQPLSTPPSASAVGVAHHWQHAGEWARAGAWNLHAARWANTRDMQITAQQFQLALHNLDRAAASPEVQKMRIAARAGLIRMAQFVSLDPSDIERAYDEARQLCADSGDIASAAELMISYGNELLHRGDAHAAVEQHAGAVRLCLEHGEAQLVKRFRMGLLLSHFSAGRPREGIAWVDRADDGAWRREPIGEDNFMSRGFHGLLLAWLGDLPRGVQQVRTALEYARREDRAASWMYGNMVDLAWFTGDYSEALEHARIAMDRAQSFSSVFFDAISARSLALALCLHGQHREAIPLIENVRPHTQPGGLVHQFEANHLAVLSRAYLGAGRLDEAERAAEEGIASAQRSHSLVWEIYAWLARLDLPTSHLPQSRVEQGLERLALLIDQTGAEGFRPWMLLARARWSSDDAGRHYWQAEAARGFEAIGAPAHARHWHLHSSPMTTP